MPDNYFDEEEFESRFNGKVLVRILQLTVPHMKWVIGFLLDHRCCGRTGRRFNLSDQADHR